MFEISYPSHFWNIVPIACFRYPTYRMFEISCPSHIWNIVPIACLKYRAHSMFEISCLSHVWNIVPITFLIYEKNRSMQKILQNAVLCKCEAKLFGNLRPSCSPVPNCTGGGRGQLPNFQFSSTHFNLLATPTLKNFENFLALPIIVNSPSLAESRWKKQRFVVVEVFQAVFSNIGRFSKSILPLKDQNMQFWFVSGISKAVKDPYLPSTHEWFV